MVNLSAFEDYLQRVNLRKFLEELGVSDVDMIVEEFEHFTEREAEKRDQIVSDSRAKTIYTPVRGVLMPLCIKFFQWTEAHLTSVLDA